jgi:hypothetical protein
MEDTRQKVICSICNNPVVDGQARYSVTGDHYDCEYPVGQPKIESFRKVIADMDTSLQSLTGRPPKRIHKPIGSGAIATKVKAMVFKALEQYVDGAPADVVMWIQPPEYRGPRWDVAGWGLHCKYKGVSVSVHSWDTMTNCAKSKRLAIVHEGGMSFDVGPVDN